MYDYQPQSLSGKAIVVTGGTTGIGRTTAIRLAQAGAKILITGTEQSHLDDAIRDLQAVPSAQVFGIISDQSKPEEIKRTFAEADSKLGGVDILVNNAALAAGSILESEVDEWNHILHVNLLGYMACCREALDRMLPKGKGDIVNIGSMSAESRGEGSDIYVATKSGLQGFNESLAKQVNPKGIRITLIEPGLVGTDMTVEKVPVEEQPQAEAEGTMLKSEDIAECVYYTLTQPERCNIAEILIRPIKETE